MKHEIHMYGEPEQKAVVEVDDGDCPWCLFVQQNVRLEAGAVVFVCNGDRIRRVCALFHLPPLLALECSAITPEEIEREMAEFAEGSA